MGPGFWKHEAQTDTFIEVLKVYNINVDYIKVKVRFWNQGCCGKPWAIQSKASTEKIMRKDLPKWKPYEVVQSEGKVNDNG